MVGLRPVGGNPCLLAADDPRLVRSRDPLRSAARIREAELSGDRELEVRDRVLALLADHGETLADRTTSVGHLTGSALVLDSTAQRTLLMLHTKLDRWLQPGGHADGDHELAGVALKEATEETGIVGLRVRVPAIDIDIHSVDHGDDLGEHLHLERFSLELGGDGGEGGTITFRTSGKSVEVDGATTVLEAGEEAGVGMPYGCRMGICHTCTLTLVSGTVRDLRNGEEFNQPNEQVQTCVTAAVGECTLDI